ncbi:MAG TPA: hypothetical protein DIC52_20315 [Candidatus Latescibacteria bacterium]|nr:hypothetical protein [Candidatus Latescibacterota bacterium]
MPGSELPFTRKNWLLFGVGLLVIVSGYGLLRIPPVDGFLSLTAAPVLLVVGYCVLVPAAILVREADRSDADTGNPRA